MESVAPSKEVKSTPLSAEEVSAQGSEMPYKVEEVGISPQVYVEHMLCASTSQGATDSRQFV